MKKSILSLVAVVALSLMGTGAFAQSSIGIFNGARSFASKVDGADKTESTAGSTFGISYEHNTRLGSLLGVSAGVDLGVFGANDFFDIKDYTVVESYIDIPIRGKVFIPLGNSVDLNVFAGFVPSYCLGSWGKVDKDDDATNRFKDNDWVVVSASISSSTSSWPPASTSVSSTAMPPMRSSTIRAS